MKIDPTCYFRLRTVSQVNTQSVLRCAIVVPDAGWLQPPAQSRVLLKSNYPVLNLLCLPRCFLALGLRSLELFSEPGILRSQRFVFTREPTIIG